MAMETEGIIRRLRSAFRSGNRAATIFPFVGSDKIIYAIDGVSQFMIHYIMDVHSPVEVPRLTEAIELALAKYPILKSLARLRWVGSYWEVVESLTSESFLTVKDLSQEHDGEQLARGIIEDYINEYIDITRSLPIRFLLIRLSAARWLFVVKAHHCPIDAAALFLVIDDIRRFYEALLQGASIPPFDRMEDRGRKRLLGRISLRLWARAISMALWAKIKALGCKHKEFVGFSPSSGPYRISYRTIKFVGQEYDSLRARCKSLRITGNELVLAALCRAIYRWNGGSEHSRAFYSIVMPVDLRRYARRGGKIPRIIASFMGGAQLTIPARAAATVEEIVEQVTRQTRYIKNHHQALVANLIFPFLCVVSPRWLRRRAKRVHARRASTLAPTSVVSNLGKIDRALPLSKNFAIHGIEGVGTAYAPAGLFLAPMSYRRQQMLTLTYRKDVCSEDEIDDFVKLLSEELLPARQVEPAAEEFRSDSEPVLATLQSRPINVREEL